jgi:hypothetical protein
VKRSFLAGYSLHDDARVFVNKYAQAFLPRKIFVFERASNIAHPQKHCEGMSLVISHWSFAKERRSMVKGGIKSETRRQQPCIEVDDLCGSLFSSPVVYGWVGDSEIVSESASAGLSRFSSSFGRSPLKRADIIGLLSQP